MNDFHTEKLKRFANDPVMLEVVYDVLLGSFLKRKSGEDVETKAARFVATELLTEGFQEIEKFKNSNNDESPPVRNVGL